jgi:hypothetical protein
MIPEGRAAWGWHGISHGIDSVLRPRVMESHGAQHRRPEGGESTAEGYVRKESHTFKEAVILGGNIPKAAPLDTGVKIDLNKIGNGLGNGATEISLKIILGLGQTNNWEVKWAGVVDGSSGEPALQNQAPQAPKPTLRINEQRTHVVAPVRPNAARPNQALAPHPTKAWRPRVKAATSTPKSLEDLAGSSSTPQPDSERVSVHSCDTDSQLSLAPSHSCDRPIAELCKASAWWLDRGGRRVTGFWIFEMAGACVSRWI